MRSGQIVDGRYRLEARLGSGGHGEVWRGSDLKLHERPVALKRTRFDDDDGADRVRREAEVLVRINHPHVVAVHDVAEDDEVWVVMEYVAGRTLAEAGQLTVEQAARYGAQLADGLAAVHAHRILHRDLKPSNVLLTDDGFAKIADFGISRALHDDETVTSTGALTGTPGYLAPDVAKGGRFTEPADVWSLGATLYYALEGTTPFGDDNPHALLWKTVSTDVRTPVRAGAMAPVLLRMLAKEPGDRPGLEQVRRELAELAGEQAARSAISPTAQLTGERRSRTTDEHPAEHPGRPVARPVARTRGPLAVTVLAVVLTVAVSTAVWLSSDRGVARGDQATLAVTDPDGSTGTNGDGDAANAAVSPGVIGDPATADPCALLDVPALGDLGLAEVDTDTGELNRCDVYVTSGSGAVVEASVKIWHNSEEPVEPNRQVGKVTVVNDDSELPDECSRELFLRGGQYNLSLDAERQSGDVADLCSYADASLNHTLDVLNSGQIPRRERTPDPDSLYQHSACDLLSGEPLEQVPGVDADHPLVGFAEWDCTWHAGDQQLRALFQHREPFGGDAGESHVLSGHQVVDEGTSWSADSCLVSVVNRVGPSVDGSGEPVAELIRLELRTDGDDPVDEMCDVLLDVAEPLAAALPPPS